MIKNSSTLIAGALAFGIYFTLIALLLFYFNSRDEKKAVHFVKKNEDRIRVSMSAPTQKKEAKKEVKKAAKPKPKPEPKPEPKKVVKPKPEPKPKKVVKEKVVEKKVVEKKVIKEKVVKKVKPPKKTDDVNKTKPKKVNKPKDLFANVSSKKHVEKPKQTPKSAAPSTEPNKIAQEKASASKLLFDSLKQQKSSDKGIENAYLALIEEKLRGWPAQSEYAGEKAKVWIKVEPSVSFVFKVISASGSQAFNEGLEAYLTQLQRIGFGRHKAERAYELDVVFEAKE